MPRFRKGPHVGYFQERKIRTDANISRANRGMLLEENHKQQQAIMRNANRDYRNIQPVAP
jgi:hypothetical protein